MSLLGGDSLCDPVECPSHKTEVFLPPASWRSWLKYIPFFPAHVGLRQEDCCKCKAILS